MRLYIKKNWPKLMRLLETPAQNLSFWDTKHSHVYGKKTPDGQTVNEQKVIRTVHLRFYIRLASTN